MKKEILTIDKKRVRECMEDCPEFKDIAIKLWPEIELEMKEKTPEVEKVDITKDIDWEVMDFDGSYWLIGVIDGDEAFYIKSAEAMIFNHPCYKKKYDIIDMEQAGGFKIVRKAK